MKVGTFRPGLVVALALGAVFGWVLKPTPPVTLQEAISALSKGSAGVNFNLLPSVWDAVHSQYVDTNVDDQALLDGAISGLVSGLGDPYSAYLPPAEAKQFSQELEGKVEGIGAEIGVKDGAIVVIAPLPDSPAEKAGVLAGDRILTIDGVGTTGLTIDAAVSKIRGPAGSKVSLLLVSGEAEPRTITITRATIHVDSVTLKTVPGADGAGPILEISIRSFTPDTDRELVRLLTPKLSPVPSGILLDLRDNPGGFLDTAIAVTGEFLPSGVAVIEEQRDGAREPHSVAGKPLLPIVPMVVLINHGSASAAEILAGALQDAGRATILGTKSFGKGTVQTLTEIPGGGDLKLTVARWLTPKGRSISKEGIAPDRVVEAGTTSDTDPQLDAALEILRKKP
jgi:carboxyl-terminal processing protease